MKYKVTSDSLIGEFRYTTDNFEDLFIEIITDVFKVLNYQGTPIPTDMVIKNGEEKIVFEYTYPINSDPVSIVFNIEEIK